MVLVGGKTVGADQEVGVSLCDIKKYTSVASPTMPSHKSSSGNLRARRIELASSSSSAAAAAADAVAAAVQSGPITQCYRGLYTNLIRIYWNPILDSPPPLRERKREQDLGLFVS